MTNKTTTSLWVSGEKTCSGAEIRKSLMVQRLCWRGAKGAVGVVSISRRCSEGGAMVGGVQPSVLSKRPGEALEAQFEAPWLEFSLMCFGCSGRREKSL